jgi:hypothetical protein
MGLSDAAGHNGALPRDVMRKQSSFEKAFCGTPKIAGYLNSLHQT